MKLRHSNVELVTEVAKTWAWEGREIQSWDQVEVFAEQLQAETRVLRAGGMVVTDSPLAQQLAYARSELRPPMMQLGELLEKDYPGLHIWVSRTVPYEPAGRFQKDRQAAVLMDGKIHFWSQAVIGVRFTKDIDPTSPAAVDEIIDLFMKRRAA
jgi:hypothetical protein